MRNKVISNSQPKFTRGEKCIFIHLLLTIGLVLVLLVVYLMHIFIVDHSQNVGIFATRRGFSPQIASSILKKLPIGLIYLEVKPKRDICNAFPVTQEWSISAGHCVAMRSDPELANYLPTWRIKYLHINEDIKIKKSVVHPHFNRDSFANNIGLLQHVRIFLFNEYRMPFKKNIYVNSDGREYKDLAIVGWGPETSKYTEKENDIDIRRIQTIPLNNCSSYVAPVTKLRIYEFCIVSIEKINSHMRYGAVVLDLMDFTILGFFTWGETQQRFLPLVVLNLSYFEDWIGSVTLTI